MFHSERGCRENNALPSLVSERAVLEADGGSTHSDEGSAKEPLHDGEDLGGGPQSDAEISLFEVHPGGVPDSSTGTVSNRVSEELWFEIAQLSHNAIWQLAACPGAGEAANLDL